MNGTPSNSSGLMSSADQHVNMAQDLAVTQSSAADMAARRARYERNAGAVGGVFTVWSLLNIARGTNDSAVVLWTLLAASALISRLTSLRSRSALIAFAICSYTSHVVLVPLTTPPPVQQKRSRYLPAIAATH